MKFTKKQIEEVTALQTDFVEKILLFGNGIAYAYEMSGSEIIGRKLPVVQELVNEIFEFEVEEYKIGEIDISESDDVDTYIVLGGYFERIEELVKQFTVTENISLIGTTEKYKKGIIKTLKE